MRDVLKVAVAFGFILALAASVREILISPIYQDAGIGQAAYSASARAR